MGPLDDILRLSQPSLALSSADVQEAGKLAEVLKCFMLHQAERFISDRLDEPVGEVLMQDITPLSTHTVHTSHVKGLQHVCRRGRKKRKY